ncbi:ABC transporter ATP-binding protein [Paenibacillus sp. PvR148]
MIFILKVSRLSKSFGGVQAVKDVSLEIKEGEIIGLIGPNGAGKTTLFNMISYTTPYNQGEVIFMNRSLSGLSTQEIARSGIVKTFQTPIGFPNLSCLDNLLVVPSHKGERISHSIFQHREVIDRERENYEKAIDLLKKINLYDKRNELAANLSAGELRLLEISRQLMLDPKLLMLDEPASGINPAMLEKLVEHIQILRQQGMTFLIIDHNLGFIMEICDRMYVLAHGEIIASGTPQEVANNPLVKSVYLGEAEHDAS